MSNAQTPLEVAGWRQIGQTPVVRPVTASISDANPNMA
jgi:hypothetical protein